MLKKYILVFLLLSLFFYAAAKPETTIRVGLIETQPFVIGSEDGDYRGMSVDLWRIVAANADWNYRFISYHQDTSAGIKALSERKIDVLIGSISVTNSRLNLVDFSRPYFISRVGLLTTTKKYSFWGAVERMCSYIISTKLWILFFSFLLAIPLVWFVDRGLAFPMEFKKGILKSTWFLFSSIFLNGKGCKDLQSRIGVVISTILYLISSFIKALLIAGLSSALVISFAQETYNKLSDLNDKTIGVVRGSVAIELAENLKLKYLVFDNKKLALQALTDNKVIGVIQEFVSAEIYLNENPNSHFELAPLILNYDETAFAFQKNSPYQKMFNNVLTKLQDTNKMTALCNLYLNARDAPLCDL